MATWFSVVAVLSALAYAVLGGVFLAFSDFIMRALDRVSEPTGVDTMQAIIAKSFAPYSCFCSLEWRPSHFS